MNVFDFVFIVALGSTLSSTILSSNTSLADGVTAFVSLIGLQILLSWLCVTSHRVDRIVNGEPSLLVHRGKFLNETMKRERVTKEEILAAIRNKGLATIDDIDSIVLETDGAFSIIWQKKDGESSSMSDVDGHPKYVPDDQREARHGSLDSQPV
jgi:uncharacterized membrane protein YcaP (DUF421 family)